MKQRLSDAEIVLIGVIIIVFILAFGLAVSALMDTSLNTKPCSEMGDVLVSDLPSRCLK